jgi:hypothetical protein
MRGVRYSFRVGSVVVLALAVAALAANAMLAAEPTIDELKAKLSAASTGEKPHLCVQIAERQLTEADKLYAAADVEKAQPALTDVVVFSEQARDYAIQSHKYQKQTEIAVRGMTRKLTDLMHTMPHDDQLPIQDAIKRLQRVRDDLLTAMFPKGAQ